MEGEKGEFPVLTGKWRSLFLQGRLTMEKLNLKMEMVVAYIRVFEWIKGRCPSKWVNGDSINEVAMEEGEILKQGPGEMVGEDEEVDVSVCSGGTGMSHVKISEAGQSQSMMSRNIPELFLLKILYLKF